MLSGLRSRLETSEFFVELNLPILSLFYRHFLRARRWDRDTCLACCSTGSISAPGSPLTSEPRKKQHAFSPRFHPLPYPTFFLPFFQPAFPSLVHRGKALWKSRERERDGRVISPIFRTRVFAIEQLINALATVAPAPVVVNCYSVQIELCPTCWKGGGGRIIIRTIIILALNVNICGLKRKKKRGYIFFFSRFSFLSACPVQEFRKVNCKKNLAKYFARVSLKKGKKRIWFVQLFRDTKWIGKRSF